MQTDGAAEACWIEEEGAKFYLAGPRTCSLVIAPSLSSAFVTWMISCGGHIMSERKWYSN
jgi:hypothetical protein